MDMFTTLVVVISKVCTYVQTHQTIYIKQILFAFQFYLFFFWCSKPKRKEINVLFYSWFLRERIYVIPRGNMGHYGGQSQSRGRGKRGRQEPWLWFPQERMKEA
jgi:hypothetical protein